LDTVRWRGVRSSFTGVNIHVGRVRHEDWGAVGLSVLWRFPEVSSAVMLTALQSALGSWKKLCKGTC